MSNEPTDGGAPAWEQILREMLGPAADDALRELRERGLDPAAIAAAQGMPSDPATLAAAFAQVQRLMTGAGSESVNWSMAHDLARQQAAVGGDPALVGAQTRAVIDALALAELWLDEVTDLPAAAGTGRAWSRAQWVEATLPTWRTLTEPIAASLSRELANLLERSLGEGAAALPPGLGGDPAQLVRRLGSAVFGLQVGQAAGTLAREVFGTTDIGLPLLDTAAPALVETNVAAFAAGLDAPLDEVRLFLALREAAASRLFAHVGWLRAWLLGSVEEYARHIAIDPEQLEDAVRSIDPTDPAALQQALTGGVFAPQTTPEQTAALERLETALALVEGWVDEVSATAATTHLPHAVALREMVRRRRAAGGPAEQTFATLVGLELRPRRMRDAAALWAIIASGGGPGGRDAVWQHPDLLPTAEDLDDPTGYGARRKDAAEGSADLDRALAQILGPDDPAGPGTTRPDPTVPDDEPGGQGS